MSPEVKIKRHNVGIYSVLFQDEENGISLVFECLGSKKALELARTLDEIFVAKRGGVA
jgi:hypothetical protein